MIKFFLLVEFVRIGSIIKIDYNYLAYFFLFVCVPLKKYIKFYSFFSIWNHAQHTHSYYISLRIQYTFVCKFVIDELSSLCV